MHYSDFFELATGVVPFPWQASFRNNNLVADVLDIPTGLGKTAGVGLAWMHQHLQGEPTPRRLVWCLPMRVLVEQTRDAFNSWVANVAPAFAQAQVSLPTVHIMMGGDQDEDWEAKPEEPCVIIGTQDMLLSRALMRGYGMSRYRWPIHFAMLNNDAFWVFDETQLMGVGVETSAQLAGLRTNLGTMAPTKTLWMSATLNPRQLDTFDHHTDTQWNTRTLEESDHAHPFVTQRTQAPKPIHRANIASQPSDKPYSVDVAKLALELHQEGTLTLIVVNQVKRATAIYQALIKEGRGADQTGLIHSRFRPPDREIGLDLLSSQGDRIVVATQVVEAGVDCSARVLITELCPWPSFVQRAGRCNRYGERDDATIAWIDITQSKESQLLPYDAESLNTALRLLEHLEDGSPNTLGAQPYEEPAKVRPVVRKKDVLALFDTTPDLTGFDLDISRWIRDGRDTDLGFFWRDIAGAPPADAPTPHRQELCSVGIGEASKFLKKLKSRDVNAYIYDHLDRNWQPIGRRSILPGMQVMLPLNAGGYDQTLGWTGAPPKKAYALSVVPKKGRPATGYDHDQRTWTQQWYPLDKHLDDVYRATHAICELLIGDDALSKALNTAARWHDVGKAHEAFQRAIVEPAIHSDQIAPPPGAGPWAKSNHRSYKQIRPRFRHELVSALAFWQVGQPTMPPNMRALVAYVIAAHHGKVRMAIRSFPDEEPPRDAPFFALGVHHGDHLPSVNLGDGTSSKACQIDLSVMALGPGSWRSMTEALLDTYGPFKLAYLESLMRIGDWRGSALADPDRSEI